VEGDIMRAIHRAITVAAFITFSAPGYVLAATTAQATAAKATDSDLADRISHRLDTDAMVAKYDIKASVDHGVATLTGTVATAGQKAQAGRLAQGPGITRVDNKITVDKDVDKSLMDKAKAGLSKTGETINDAWITTKVKYHFMGENLLKGSDINVDTADHVVTLKGTVKTAAGRARAVALAKQTEGVTRVVDQLTIGTAKR
jgi:osmotically-inducible protein OsmY